jgi:hypothetical protein
MTMRAAARRDAVKPVLYPRATASYRSENPPTEPGNRDARGVVEEAA